MVAGTKRIRSGQTLRIAGSVCLPDEKGSSAEELRGQSARAVGVDCTYRDSEGRERVSVETESGAVTSVPTSAIATGPRSAVSYLSDAAKASYRRIFGHD